MSKDHENPESDGIEDQKSGSEDSASTTPKKKPGGGKRPFPKDSIEQCRKIAQVIKDYNGGNPWEPIEIGKAVDLKMGSVFFYLTSSAVAYGMTIGTRDAKEISLTELGQRLVYPESAHDEANAVFECFNNVALFKQVYEYYQGGKLPEMTYLSNTLKKQFGLEVKYHSDFHDLYQSNLNYLQKIGFDSDDNGKSDAKGSLPYRSITVGESKNKSGLLAFVAMPFSEKTGEYSNGYFDEVLKQLIAPAAVEAGFEARTALKSGSEVIQATVVKDIASADLVIVDLTEHNPNVLFELGMRIVFNKPVCLIRASGTAPIFDVDNMLRVFDYNVNLWPSTVEADIPELAKHIKATWDGRDNDTSYLDLLLSQP